MYYITTLIRHIIFNHNPNYTYSNNYKVKQYNTIETNKYNSNFIILSGINIDYDRYKLSTFIENNNIINNNNNIINNNNNNSF